MFFNTLKVIIEKKLLSTIPATKPILKNAEYTVCTEELKPFLT